MSASTIGAISGYDWAHYIEEGGVILRPFLVDIPVAIVIWKRPRYQKIQFEILRSARPSTLFLISDGGRNEQEMSLIKESRAIYNDIDWDCEVHRLFFDSNQGIYTMDWLAFSFIWDRVDRVLVLEDDIIPSVGSFRFAAELLDLYKDDLRIFGICLMNDEGSVDCGSSSYFFSKGGSIWGMAYWRRSHDARRKGFDGDSYTMHCIEKDAKSEPNFVSNLKNFVRYGGRYKHHPVGSEFWNAFSIWAENQLYIVPRINLVTCIGHEEDGTHSDELKLLPRGIQQFFDIPAREIEFPLTHPRFVTPNVDYQRAVLRKLGIGHPFVTFHRKLSRALRILFYKGPSALYRKFKNRAGKRYEK